MTPQQDDRIAHRLTALPVALRGAGFEPVDYLMIRAAAVNGLILAHQRKVSGIILARIRRRLPGRLS
jgi:hypothetical protein